MDTQVINRGFAFSNFITRRAYEGNKDAKQLLDWFQDDRDLDDDTKTKNALKALRIDFLTVQESLRRTGTEG